MALFVSYLTLKPLRKVMDIIHEIAAGNYNARVRLRGPEEIRNLADSINHMAEEIGSVELLRSDFVNNFSHEFKTPIVSIRGFAKLLKKDVEYNTMEARFDPQSLHLDGLPKERTLTHLVFMGIIKAERGVNE